jgi:hypothetical protein
MHDERLNTRWRKGFATALSKRRHGGSAKKDVAPRAVAAMRVVGQMGVRGTGKSSQSKAVV